MTTRPFPRTPNLALRRARQSMRLSQAQFAEAIRAAGNAMGAPNCCTKRLVQKWETGEHAGCRPDYLRVLQAMTGLPARDLGFRVLPDDSGEAFSPEAVARGEVGALFDADTVSMASALAMSGTTEYRADGTIEASVDRLCHALEHPSMVDSRAVEFVETATARLFELEHHIPARLFAPTVERHLALVTGLLTAAQHDGVRRLLMVSSGRIALLAGQVAFDRGDIASANRLWDAAIGAAEATVNETLLAATLTCQSYAAARRGDLVAAWHLAHNASVRIQGDDRATTWATTRVALYAAQLGERDAAEEAMARTAGTGGNLARVRPGDGTAPWMRFFDQAILLSSVAHTAALLKDPNAANHANQAVESLGPAKVKTRAIVLAECALVAALVGEFDRCLDWGGAAVILTRELEVSLAADLLHEIVPIILPYSDTREVRALLPQLTRLAWTADREYEVEQDQAVRPAADSDPVPD